MVLGGKNRDFKVLFKEIVLSTTQDSGPDSQESQPSAESLSQFHSLIMCCAQLGCKVGENYYFQMFLPEVAWSRSEPRDRMLEFYS